MRGGGEGAATFHTAEGGVSSVKLGLELQHLFSHFLKNRMKTHEWRHSKGPSTESPLVAEKQIIFFAQTVWTQVFERGVGCCCYVYGEGYSKIPHLLNNWDLLLISSLNVLKASVHPFPFNLNCSFLWILISNLLKTIHFVQPLLS